MFNDGSTGAPKARKKRSNPRSNVPFQRVTAEIQVHSTKEVASSRVFLHDLSPTGVGLFMHIPLDKGEHISLVIEQPKHLFVKGEVVWCAPYSLDTRILSEETFKYRVGIKFQFESEQERQAIHNYIREINTPKKV